MFEFDGLLSGKKILRDKHLALTVRDDNGKNMKLVAFYAPEEWKVVEAGERVRLQFTLAKNEWRNNISIEGDVLSLERLGRIC